MQKILVVQVNGDKEFKAKVIGADPLSDIAVLQLDTKEKFIPVKFGDSDKARIGDWVLQLVIHLDLVEQLHQELFQQEIDQ